MNTAALATLVLLTMVALPIAAQTAAPSPTNSDETAILRAEADFEKARAEKGLEGWLSFFADDPADLAPGAPITNTKAAMRQRLEQHWNPDLELKWQPQLVRVSRSRDLGYTAGYWQLFDRTKPNTPAIATGKYMTVWQKQKDKSWKAVADIGNQDPPADSAKH